MQVTTTDKRTTGSSMIPNQINQQKDKKREDILQREQMRNLIKRVDGRYEFDKTSIQTALKDVVEDFLDTSLCDLLEIAKHRGSDKIEIKDTLFYYRMMWNLNVGHSYSLPPKSTIVLQKKFAPQKTFKKQICEFKERVGIVHKGIDEMHSVH
ncbi:hypothetical protein ENUP19_0057G0088 [Entamoeba nuttalli]|uniref:Transcription initiation factor TFIID subunit 12 domain-containing protein n=2 Tax=Entamoeba nuttalli TaxID=412467 RepID=K2GVV4_ENTNP|nr:hypothetical protein ENU1_136400 [Entamoeba nuttalli P19]EKE39248.1 hypothetical protein ENU1_136400 [Entamoeba nuttalli P19]|eukprot:XP_008858416.1 hypothetical protein ENU1_136400 [Entamoeba nuttalli P19]